MGLEDLFPYQTLTYLNLKPRCDRQQIIATCWTKSTASTHIDCVVSRLRNRRKISSLFFLVGLKEAAVFFLFTSLGVEAPRLTGIEKFPNLSQRSIKVPTH